MKKFMFGTLVLGACALVAFASGVSTSPPNCGNRCGTPSATEDESYETPRPTYTDNPTRTATPGEATPTVTDPTGTPTPIEQDTATPTLTATDAATELVVPCPIPIEGRVCHSGSG